MTIKQVTISPKQRWWIMPEELGGGTYQGRFHEGGCLIQLDVPEIGRVLLEEGALTEYVIPEEPSRWSCVLVSSHHMEPDTFVFRRYAKGWSAPCLHEDDHRYSSDHRYLTWAELCVEYGTPTLLIKAT